MSQRQNKRKAADLTNLSSQEEYKSRRNLFEKFSRPRFDFVNVVTNIVR